MKGESPSIPTPFTLSQSLDALSLTSNSPSYFDVNQSGHATSPGESSHPKDKGYDGETIYTLPVEILAHILELAYFGTARQTDDRLRLTIGQVSRRFRHTILDAPSIWSVYTLSQGNVEQYLPVLPLFVQRSKGYPLDISLTCFWAKEITHQVMEVFIPHSHRWKHLTITTPNTDILMLLSGASVPVLESMALSHFSSERRLALPHTVFQNEAPSLSQLTLRNINLENVNIPLRNLTKLELLGFGRWPQYEQLHAMFTESESLEELTLHVKPGQVVTDIQRGDRPPIPLPRLRRIMVFISEGLGRPAADLIRTFSSPNIHALSVFDGPYTNPAPAHHQALVHYSQPVATIRSSDIISALRCILPEHVQNLRVLNLHNAIWPHQADYPSLALILRSLIALDTLVIAELDVVDGVPEYTISAPTHGNLSIPYLRNLSIDIRRDPWSRRIRSLHKFLGFFDFPNLSSLTLPNVLSAEWGLLFEMFAARAADYPVLHSLTIKDSISCPLRTYSDPFTSDTAVTATDAFPHLRHLSVINTHANPILYYLLINTNLGGNIIWPELQTLTLRGNSPTNARLLHMILQERRALDLPLSTLLLDSTFKSNQESWDWMQERVQVIELE